MFCTNGAPVPFNLDSCSAFRAAPTAVLAAADWSSDQLSVVIDDMDSFEIDVLHDNFALGVKKLATSASRIINGMRKSIEVEDVFVFIFMIIVSLFFLGAMHVHKKIGSTVVRGGSPSGEEKKKKMTMSKLS